MIISEVLDAIDIINSITIESEISMYESLLSSYDKMSLLEEYYEGNNINDFKIFQEGVLSDAKDDVKKQNEGKSTLNKILFTIPRMIAAIVKQIINLLKGTKKTADDIDKKVKALPKEKKSLLAKLFPKKEDGKADVKKIVRNLVIGVAGVAVAKGTFNIGKTLIVINANINELCNIAVKYAKLTDKDKQKEFKNKFKKALMIYQKSYSEIIKQHGDQIEIKDIINDIKKDTEVCNTFNEIIGSYKDDFKNIFDNIVEYIKGLSNFDYRTESTDSLIWKVGCIVGIIYNCITDGSKLPVSDLEKTDNADDNKAAEKDDEKLKEKLAKIEKLVEKIKNDKEYEGFTLVYDDIGFTIKDSKKNIDTSMRRIIFHYNNLVAVKKCLDDSKKDGTLLEENLRKILRRRYSDNANTIDIPSEFKYTDVDLISHIPYKITNFLSNSEYVKKCDELTAQIRNNIDKLSIPSDIENSIKDSMIYHRGSIITLQESGVIINKIIKEVNDILISIDNSSRGYTQIDQNVLNTKKYHDQELSDYILNKH